MKINAAIRLAALALCAASGAAGAQSSAPAAASAPARTAALERGYEAYLAHDAKAASKAMEEVPKGDPLRPWAQGWAALTDPTAEPRALAAFAKKFPPSLMKWRLLSLSAQQSAKAGDVASALAALSEIPPGAQGPQQRCIGALGRSAAPEEAIELLAQGGGSEACSKASMAIASNVDALGAAFARMGADPARAAAAFFAPSGPAAAQALDNMAKFNAAPQWVDQLPLSSKESLSRQAASDLGKGKCPAEEPPPEHLTDKGAANAARCALWSSGPAAAAPYWNALAQSRPREPRWAALAWLAGGPGAAPAAPDTSYPGLALREAAGGSTPPASQPAAAARCDDASVQLDLALWSSGLRRETIDSWREELSRAEPARKACMGLAAQAIEAHSLRIAAFASDGFDPRAYAPGYEKIARASAAAHGIPEELWLSLARQESRFDAEAVSRTGALGLFQLMPGTARDAAAGAGMGPPTPASLRDPEVNSAIASSYFSKIQAQFGGSTIWSLCAYNAGAGRCRGWKAKLDRLPPVFQIEAMPYDETRGYVERILSGWTLTAPVDPARAAFLAEGIRPKSAAKPAAKAAPPTPVHGHAPRRN